MQKMLLCLVAGVLLLAAFAAFAPEQAQEPVFQEGNFWQFRVAEKYYIGFRSDAPTGNYEVVFTGGRLKVYSIKGNQKVEEGKAPHDSEPEDAQGMAETELRSLLSSSQFKSRYLQFPLFVGKKWTEQYTSTARGARQKRSRRAETQVTGIEKITTPAGTFTAFKIERDTIAGPGSHWKYTYYYSPETKSIVKYQFDGSIATGVGGKREIELIKFGSGR